MASHLVTLRAADPANTIIDPPGSISFLHPGYTSPHDILFHLPKLDTIAASTKRGVHHGIARLACQVIASNAFDGYLSCDCNGQQRVTLGYDELLTGDKYWFFPNAPDPTSTSTPPPTESNGDGPLANARPQPLSSSARHRDDDDDTWPVVPSFQDWQFPHNTFQAVKWRLPPSDDEPSDRLSTTAHADAEPASNVGAAATTQPSASSGSLVMPPPPLGGRTKADEVKRCAISGTSYSLQRGHCIPAAEEKWFKQNGMQHCMHNSGPGSYSVHHTSNRLNIRHDLHHAWDSHKFVLVPKRGRYVVHVLFAVEVEDREFAAAWHNKPVNPHSLQGKPEEYLFAKFAQAVLMLLKPFISSAVRRRVARLQSNLDSEGREESFMVNTQWLSGAQLEEAYSGGGSRSASASSKRKRSRSQQADADDSDGDDDDNWYERTIRRRTSRGSSEEDEIAEAWYHNMLAMAEEEEDRGRGRPRKRRPLHPRRSDINDSTGEDADEGQFDSTRYDEVGRTAALGSESDTEDLPNLSRSFTTSGSNRSSTLLDPPTVEETGQDVVGNSYSSDKAAGAADGGTSDDDTNIGLGY